MVGDDVLPPQIWAGADSDDILTSLGIDGFIVERFNAKRPPKFIHKLPYVQRVARRAMEVGYWEAMRARRERPGPIAKDFNKLETLAGNAASALDNLIKHLDPRSVRAADLALPIKTAQAGFQGGSAQELHIRARKDALVFLRARHIARRLKETASRKEARIKEGRQNPGKPEHAAFLKPLAEMWIYLTGQRPGSATSDTNPFLVFAKEAWGDVFGAEEPDSIGALRQLPDWSDRGISRLKSDGPWWLRNITLDFSK